MIYCKRCLYPINHPLNISIDSQGICSGCRVHEEKDVLDWGDRKLKLEKIVSGYKVKTRKIHDCIIAVNGARDSHFIVHVVKNILKMHPLLVTYNKQYNTRLGIRNLAYLRTLMGCDIFTLTVSPERAKRITRETIRKCGSMYWHCLAGTTVLPVQIAAKFKIPLIFWGAHQGCDQVGMFSHLDEVEMTRKYRKEHDLMGIEAEDLVGGTENLKPEDVEQFVYPHDKEIESVGVRGIYLNNYFRWDTKAQHEEMIRLYGYKTATQQRTFDNYNDVDCFHYSGIHDYIKNIKWGYGKVTDHATREIRLKRMTREQGIEMVRRYKDVEPKDLNIFLDWVGMGKEDFFENINRFRDNRIWQRTAKEWELKDSVINHINDPGVEDARHVKHSPDINFVVNSDRGVDYDNDKYILIGKGWEE